MNKKIIIISIAVAVDGISSNDRVETNVAFHVTLADPKLYVNGVFTESFEIGKGEYSFRFVPNGSSPETLSISLRGLSLEFAQDFSLEWKYNGQKNISVSEMQEVTIVINPNGNIMGSVSVDIIQN